MAHLARGAVAVIGQRFHDHGDAAGTVAFVLQRLIIIRVAVARRFFDDALDVVVGHIVRLGFGDAVLQFGVGVRIGAAALFHRHSDLATDFGEDFGFLTVGLFFFALDIIPLRMSGHE